MADYAEELQKFNSTYKLDGFDFKNLEEFDAKFRYVDNFIMNGTIGENAKERFATWAARTVKTVLEKNSKLNENGEYLTSFNLRTFLKDFDRVAAAYERTKVQEGQENSWYIVVYREFFYNGVIVRNRKNKPKT